MRLQIILPTEPAVDISVVRSYVAARYLLKNDMPIAFVVNGGVDSCRELDSIGISDTDDDGDLAEVARGDLPARGDEAQFLFCGRSRTPNEVLTAAAEWFNHLATGRVVQGAFDIVYAVPYDLLEEARRCLAVVERVPTIAVNRIELCSRDTYLVGQPTRGPRFMVEWDALHATLGSILIDLTDMDQAYNDEEG